MKKQLSELTLEELWELFPILLTPYNAAWSEWFAEERAFLAERLPTSRIHHIGSTAISGIWAKPTVDILVEAADPVALKPAILGCGYSCMSDSGDRASFSKGYTPDGFAERVFHLHLRKAGDHDELYFRDYLIDHPDAAREYEELKLRLWKRYEHDRDGYTAQKSELVRAKTALARAAYPGKYEEE